MADDDPSFDSPTAALEHYRQLCTRLANQLEAAEQDIADFTESSKELQGELERELERVEKAEKELRGKCESERRKADEWKTKYTTSLRDHTSTISHMQRELDSLRKTEKDLRGRLRDVEMSNDEMEKSEREVSSSLADVENRYNKSLERIALLEEELVEKARMEEEVQRLKDELRDLSEELIYTRTTAAASAATSSTRSPLPSEFTTPAPASPTSPTPAHSHDPRDTSDDDDDLATPRKPSAHRSPPPSIELVNPTPLLARTLAPSSAASPSLDSPDPSSSSGAKPFPASPLYRAPLSAGVPLARSTRTKQLQSFGLPSSPSSPNFRTLSSSRSGIPTSPSTRFTSSTAARARERLEGRTGTGVTRTDTATLISEMSGISSRYKQLTQRLDRRREQVMQGSAIPRASMSPQQSTSTSTSSGGLTRSATTRGIASSSAVPRPRSRMGDRDRDAEVRSTRPPSRSALRASIAGGASSIPLPGRPSSRLGTSRPLTPSLPAMPPRSPTPTGRAPWGSSAAGSAQDRAQAALSKSQLDRDRRRTSSSFGGAGAREALSKSVAGPAHGRTSSGSAASRVSGAGADLGATIRRPPSSLSSSRPSSAASNSTTASRRSSFGVGLGASVNGLARSVIGRRASGVGAARGGEGEQDGGMGPPPVPSVPRGL
ncbi:hypothetical protein JCM10207_008340 [Rhodosporidiobolus poonsookiae]